MRLLTYVLALSGIAILAPADAKSAEIDSPTAFQNFIENFVLTRLPDPIGDAVVVVKSSPDLYKASTLIWLKKKMEAAIYDDDMTRLDRYQAFYSCLGTEDCDALHELQSESQTASLDAINVVEATYGLNCTGFEPTNGTANKVFPGNATSHVAGACNGQQSCDYAVHWQLIGDPAFGCAKTFNVSYRCGAGPVQDAGEIPPEAGYGSVATLNCP